MPTDGDRRVPLPARRVFRLALVVALALVVSYMVPNPLPFLTPVFALLMGMNPSPPMGPKKLLVLVLVVSLTLVIGLLLIPVLLNYPFVAVLLVGLGLYATFYITINKGQILLGTFLTIGVTLISSAGMVAFALGLAVIQSLLLGIIIAVICQWLVYPWFPEDEQMQVSQPPPTSVEQNNWLALRGTLITLPVYLFVLSNPMAYMAIMLKSTSLAQQRSYQNVHQAGEEMLASTLLGGLFAILVWMGLSILPHLWLYFLLILLSFIYFAAKLYGLSATRFTPAFWSNVAITLIILLGPAVEDSANGRDVYMAFFVRMSLFLAVALYAWGAVYLLEMWKPGLLRRTARAPQEVLNTC